MDVTGEHREEEMDTDTDTEDDEVTKCKTFTVEVCADVIRKTEALSKRVGEMEMKVNNLDAKVGLMMNGLESCKEEVANMRKENEKTESVLNELAGRTDSTCKERIGKVSEQVEKLGMDSVSVQRTLHELHANLENVGQQLGTKVDSGFVVDSLEKYASGGLSLLRGQSFTLNTDTMTAKPLLFFVDQNNEASCSNVVVNQSHDSAGNIPELSINEGDFVASASGDNEEYEKQKKARPDSEEKAVVTQSTPKKDGRRLYTAFEELPDDLRQQLKPFSKHCKMASTDKLNAVQRAFLKWYVKKHLSRGRKRADLDKLVGAGEYSNVWSRETVMDDGKRLYTYLETRLKYEQKRIRDQSCESLLKEKLGQDEKK